MAKSRLESLIGFVHDEDPPRPVAPRRVIVLRCVWGLLVMLLTAQLVAAWLPRPPQDWTSAKLDDFELRKDEYDVVFLGSSQIYRHIDPEVFDALMVEAGHELTSFNMGVPGMAGLETRFVLKQLLAMEPARLKWIIMDVPRTGLLLSGSNHLTPRVVNWHDVDTTLLALELIQETEMDMAWKLDMARRHLMAFSYHLGAIGVWRHHIEPWVGGTAESRAEAEELRLVNGPGGLGEEGNGFVSMYKTFVASSGYERGLLRERNQKWKKVKDKLTTQLRQTPNRPRFLRRFSGERRSDPALKPAEQDLISQLSSLPEQAGLRVAFTNAPDVRQKEFMVESAELQGIIPVLLDVDDPVRFPQLTDPALRFDEMHLDQKGAAVYTACLAELFVEYLSQLDDG